MARAPSTPAPTLETRPQPRRTPQTASLPTAQAAPTTQNFIRQHPVLSFYILAFSLSAVGILTVIGGPGNFPGSADQVQTLLLPVMLAWFAGPSLSGLMLTGLVSGRAGYRDLLACYRRWRVSPGWYAVALLASPLASMMLALALSTRFPELLPNIVTSSDKGAILVMAIAYGLIGGGLLEELGWTGFAMPRLLPRYGILRAGLIAGVLWGAYHFSVIYWAGSPSGLLPLAILAAQLFAWMPPFRILMAWVYDGTQSILVLVLMHASLVASMFILQSTTMAGVAQLIFLLAFGAVWWVAIAAIGLASGGRFSGMPFRKGALV